MPKAPSPPQRSAVLGPEATAAALVEISRLMQELCEIVESETEMVRGGRLTAAAGIAARKSELAHLFMSCVSRLSAAGRPDLRDMARLLDQLTRQHQEFRKALQVNLTVLTTARAVSEGILRNLSNELGRRSNVQIYGATGRAQAAFRRPAAPISVSRSL